ncbi:MAG: amidohydrolase [Actinomycetota bacterium]|nr:amidohydrolase [Nocardioidaceae bacterium]MDQ3592240.1 amidohydrolase [Actinomycetota bacterium]
MPSASFAAADLVRCVTDELDARVRELAALRRDLHAHPELAWQEGRTTDEIASRLEAADLSVKRLDTSGLVAEVGPDDGPIVALRADLDALPVPDTTSDPWRSSVPDIAHACGHDVHAAALTGAGTALAAVHARTALPVRVRMLFQPAEEVMPGGAKALIAAGALEGVERIYALHCDPTVDVGQVGLRVGPLTGASDAISITLAGRGGHTSRPHLTEDLTYALGVLVTQLPSALSRRLDPRAGASLVWGAVHAGDALNVIPARGRLGGTLRMLDASAWHEAENLVRRLVRDLAAPYGVTADVEYVRGVPPVVNDKLATGELGEAVTATLGASALVPTSQSLGGEDFAWYVEHVPGAMGRLGTRTPGGPTYDLHQGDLRIDERATVVAAKVLAVAALSMPIT